VALQLEEEISSECSTTRKRYFVSFKTEISTPPHRP